MYSIMQINEVNEVSEHSIAALKVEKEELELALSNEKAQSLQLKQELIEAESKNTDLYKVMYHHCRQQICSNPMHSCGKVGVFGNKLSRVRLD